MNIINKLWKFLNIDENISESKTEKNNNTNYPNIFITHQNTEESINDSEISVQKKYTDSFFKNLKINDIKKLCEENNIALQKKSDKTQKMINKLKDELIADLLII
jgi:chemotaxis regulatin CheY-phosphate phosphatase CheZ